jgi:hypothetical protein
MPFALVATNALAGTITRLLTLPRNTKNVCKFQILTITGPADASKHTAKYLLEREKIVKENSWTLDE